MVEAAEMVCLDVVMERSRFGHVVQEAFKSHVGDCLGHAADAHQDACKVQRIVVEAQDEQQQTERTDRTGNSQRVALGFA